MTGKSHVTAQSLWDDIAKVQSQYFAFDDEEHSPGLRCVASPLFDNNAKVIGALSISGRLCVYRKQAWLKLGNLYHASHASYPKHLAGHGQQVNLFRQQIVPPMRQAASFVCHKSQQT